MKIVAEFQEAVVREDVPPRVSLRGERVGQRQQEIVARAVVEPQDRLDLVARPGLAPFLQAATTKGARHVLIVAREKGGDARVAGGLGVVAQQVVYDHARPPVVVRPRTDGAIGTLAGEDGIDPFLYLRFEIGVVEGVGERDQPFEVVWAFFPVLAPAAQPGVVGMGRGQNFLGVSGETIALEFELAQEPSPRPNTAQRQRDKRRRGQRRAVGHRSRGGLGRGVDGCGYGR